jgi:phosphoribosylglycinamide formyltransferase-1
MMNIAVLASGRGSNFASIIRARKRGLIKANLSLLLTDNPEARAIQKAKAACIKVVIVKREDFASKQDFEETIIRVLKENKIDLIILAGFMRMLSPAFVRRFRNKILNIHPALLPSFKGSYGIKDAFIYGAKATGVTVHFVDEKMDHGPIILQSPVMIGEKDTLATLEEKIHKVEHKLYPEAIKLFVSGRLKIKGRKVFVSTR